MPWLWPRDVDLSVPSVACGHSKNKSKSRTLRRSNHSINHNQDSSLPFRSSLVFVAPCGVASPPVILACPWRGGEQPIDHPLQRRLLAEHFFCGRRPPRVWNATGFRVIAQDKSWYGGSDMGPLLISVSESRGQVAAGDCIGRSIAANNIWSRP